MGYFGWFPHYRAIDEFEIEKEVAPESSEGSESTQTVAIREFRDEANKSWWQSLDEYEYRETKEEKKAHKWWYWFEPGTSAAEKKLILKLDVLIAFYSFMGYWIKYLDSANLNNAYVSGMKEDIGMKGNDLINTQVLFSVGMIIFEIPWVYFLPRVPTPYAVFGCEMIWATFTLCLYRVQNVSALKGLRFCIGGGEAIFFPAVHHLLANWYTPTEINRRGGFFYMGQFLGVLTSGLVQSAAFRNLNGINGLAGWRWMFIIDGCISYGVAILALFMIPGTPTYCYSLFLTDDEVRLARKRMAKNHSSLAIPTVKAFFNWKSWKNILTSWQLWLFSISNMLLCSDNNTSSGSYSLWLKSLDRYSVGKLNDLSTVPPALGIVWLAISCFGADFTRKRFLMMIAQNTLNFIPNVILAKWDVSETAKRFAFYMSYWSWTPSSIFNPLLQDTLRHNVSERNAIWMIVYIMGTQSATWISKLIWPTVDAPRYPAGFASCAGFSMGFSFLLVIMYILYKRDERRRALDYGIYVYNSAKGETIPPEYRSTPASSLKQTVEVQDTEVSQSD